MISSWSICLAREDGSSLAALRLFSGLEVSEYGGVIWLRGQQADERLKPMLSALPARERYEWQLPNQLRLIGQRIPTGEWPNLQWQRLEDWLQVEIASSALPANLPAVVQLRLVRSTHEREPDLLLTRLDELIRFAATAAQVRLARLQCAVDVNGNSLVRGQPLPPVPGKRFVVHAGVAVPAGLSWKPAVSADVLTRRFGVSGDALAVWSEDGSITRLHSEQFVPLSRSGLRATQQALADSP